MDRYKWNILGLCEMRWKNFGETTTEEGHKVFFSGKEDKHAVSYTHLTLPTSPCVPSAFGDVVSSWNLR